MTDLKVLQAAAEEYRKWELSGVPLCVVKLVDFALRCLPKGIESAPKDREILVMIGDDWWSSNRADGELCGATLWCELPPVAEGSL